MSSIAIVLNDQKLEVVALEELHKIVGGSLGELKSTITNGKPILEMELFDGEYEEKAVQLRDIAREALINSSNGYTTNHQ